MFNQEKFSNMLKEYKNALKKHWWGNEEFKWKAIHHFQNNWDIRAEDFHSMFKESLSKTEALLVSNHYFPQRVMTFFAERDPEAVREMFINLFNENIGIYERITTFISKSEILRIKYNPGNWNEHYQNLNSISTYLWLKYPDKYYIYKYTEYRNVAKELESEYITKTGLNEDNVKNNFRVYNEINNLIKQDQELIDIFESLLTTEHYPDPELKTLTIDFGYFLNIIVKERKLKEKEEWYYKDYSPGLEKEDWLELFENEIVFTKQSFEVLKRLKDFGGMATCTQLSEKYGNSVGFYNVQSSSLAMRIAKEKKIKGPKSNDQNKWWPILYEGKDAEKDTPGQIYWKIRDELNKALNEIDMETIDLYSKEESRNINYWWLNANPNIWSFSDISVNQVVPYTMYNEKGNKRSIFRNFENAKIGDYVIGYETNPQKKAVCLLKIVEKVDNEKIIFEKLKNFTNLIEYSDLKDEVELANMEFFINPNGTFFKLTEKEYNIIIDLVMGLEESSKEDIDTYTKNNFLDEVFISEEDYNGLVQLLLYKQNIILQGPPGVGKTFIAKRLVYSIMGVKDDSKVKFIQFHQNYSYEDFIMGYKPVEDGFKLTKGIFFDFCIKAGNDKENKHFFIIDEINRGNMSKVFGELLMLIEKDYREQKITLAYSGQAFHIPDNIYIIGMMNTADRSIAMIDYALRRRFSFYEIKPGFLSEGFIKYKTELDDELFNELINKIQELNREICDDSSLGKGFALGHSYFCNQKVSTESWLKQVIEYEIIPMLNEYWFDETDKLRRWENSLRTIFNG